MNSPHSLDLTALDADSLNGLSEAEAARRLRIHGPNELRERPPEPAWKRFLEQFRQPIILLLFAAAALSAIAAARGGDFHHWVEVGAILAIVLANGILGFIQEERASRSLAALKKLSAPEALVVRDGRSRSVPARELVPGDRVELQSGARVPADARLLESIALRVQESALTGESEPVSKRAGPALAPGTPLATRHNVLFAGTSIAAGRATALVVSTGMDTELGRIASLLNSEEREATPLERRMHELGRMLIGVCLAAGSLIFALHMFWGGEVLETILLAASVVVAAVPEGLPAVVTIVLALGMQRMVTRKALVRTLPSVETLGSVSVICSDKTGTLTRDQMTVSALVSDGLRYRVTGSGYGTQGEIRLESGEPALHSPLRLLEIVSLCNNAKLGEPPTGDPTEIALLVAAAKAGVVFDPSENTLLQELPFDSDRKAMSVAVRLKDGRQWHCMKGAPEVVLQASACELRDGNIVPLSDSRRAEIKSEAELLAARALRVIGAAYRELEGCEVGPISESGLVFAGLVAMADPPRDEVPAAVERARSAGIRVVMITGDHPSTAIAIARAVGIAGSGHGAVTGAELDAMADEELDRRVTEIPVYARVTAQHKLRIVHAFKRRGQVVAMTGDGVNDAPAVKAADIGISMGVTGTDVTREASGLVLLDDNFATIVASVEEGRTIVDNIRKFLHFQIASNIGCVLMMLVAALAGLPAPLTALQILWINLVTDGLPALALGLEPPEGDVMKHPPRPAKEAVLPFNLATLIVGHGLLIGATLLAGFALIYWGEASAGLDSSARLARAQTATFALMAFGRLAFSFACRGRRPMFQLGVLGNPKLLGAVAISFSMQMLVLSWPVAAGVFSIDPSLTWEWLIVGVGALIPVTVVEALKLRSRKFVPASSVVYSNRCA